MELYTCSLCEWQCVDGDPADAFRHLETVHGSELDQIWRFASIK